MKETNTQRIVVRMAPSPTGNLHLGTSRTALFNFLFARQNGGKYILRIEDTDKNRSTKEFETNILDGLKWLGLGYDEFTRQSERNAVYEMYLNKMIEGGMVYLSEEKEGERNEVIRFKNPNKKISFDDLVRGKVEFDTTDLGDFVIAKSLTEPLYHLAVVVDDFESRVTHVIRGEDHISNTPRQILIQEAIGASRPIYAHLPLILATDRSKLSKRKHGDIVSIRYYREKGFSPEALTNYLALLGWNPGDEREIFSLDELIKEFNITKVNKSGAIFDENKLRWINREHLKFESEKVHKQISEKIRSRFNVDVHPKLIDIVFERIEVLGDVDELISAGELDYFFVEPTLDKDKLIWKKSSWLDIKDNLLKVRDILNVDEDLERTRAKIMALAENIGRGEILWPMRYALSGREKSPDPFSLVEILGRQKSIERLERAVNLFE
jgi:glutamyl-tRNA synthetase